MSNFISSPHQLQAFHVNYLDQPGLPQRLKNWLQAWENSKNDVDDHPDDEYTQDWGQPWFKEGGCHAAQIVVNELVLKLLCSYRWENQAWEKEKEEEEEIKAVWPL